MQALWIARYEGAVLASRSLHTPASALCFAAHKTILHNSLLTTRACPSLTRSSPPARVSASHFHSPAHLCSDGPLS